MGSLVGKSIANLSSWFFILEKCDHFCFRAEKSYKSVEMPEGGRRKGIKNENEFYDELRPL